MLRGYLVAGVEDPRINVQSILSRHFLVRASSDESFSALMEQEYRFAAAMNWLAGLAGRLHDAEELQLVLYALGRGADNVEGIEIPHYVLEIFSSLPANAGAATVPNYIERFLSSSRFVRGRARPHEPSLNTFRQLWRRVLKGRRPASSCKVLEPACGSANDYRFLDAYGLAPLVTYAGFDLCAKNIENARELFPGVRFELGNVFELGAPDKAFDLCFIHDLFEHLSPGGLEAAVKEVCRVTRLGLCIGFFNMDEIREHLVRSVDEYHWNLLSMGRMKELFARHGFDAQVLHIGTFLRQQVGCEHTHNPNAYTFILRRPNAPEMG
jgi:SAM-dependent methyltransferase